MDEIIVAFNAIFCYFIVKTYILGFKSILTFEKVDVSIRIYEGELFDSA